ncbi:MAG: DsbC family protein [Oryzomonas sp.]|uniref:DsbC family protein n=1 Tax=Oryzomonas sp. TaxID=2855186 RepID=UPI00284D1431|nr:DsbC family protein [Oryzomonas sp.]MDR3580925.1 DsbC family protein [Oryzomonas sp.]
MIIKKMMTLLPLLAVIAGKSVYALPATQGCSRGTCTACHNLTVMEATKLLSNLGATIKEVKESPISGLWELTLDRNGERASAYMDYGKKYVLGGPLFSAVTKQRVNSMLEVTTGHSSRIDINVLPTGHSIVMGNPMGKKKLFVFSDPDCPYCAKLHGELKQLAAMEPDLSIYVKMYPLKMHPHAYDKARVILGANTIGMLDRAFAGQTLPQPGPGDPAGPVDDTIKLADAMGIDSTPTFVLPSGRIISGSKSAAEIRSLLTR